MKATTPKLQWSEHGTCKINVRENGHGSSPPEISEVNIQKLGYPSNRLAFQPHRYIQDKTCREMARDGIQAFLVHWSTPGAVTECGEEKRVINLPYCSFQAVSLPLSTNTEESSVVKRKELLTYLTTPASAKQFH
jgi:hypothetical protein